MNGQSRVRQEKSSSYPFKIKEIPPEQKAVNTTKNGQIVKAIKSKKFRYFNGRNRLIFYAKKL